MKTFSLAIGLPGAHPMYTVNSYGQNTVLCRCLWRQMIAFAIIVDRKLYLVFYPHSSRAYKINKYFNAFLVVLAGLPTHILFSLGQPSLQYYTNKGSCGI
jgi:hypothetical protein